MRKIVVLLTLFVVAVACKSPEARRPISSKTGSFIDQSVIRNKKLYAKEKSHFEKLMKANPDVEYVTSQNGFWYYYNEKVGDTLTKPQFGDIVNFDYDVKTIDGLTIYSKSDTKTQTYIMDKQELFTGLREGLKLMKPGETVTFLFPSQKAYGYYGDTNKIGVNTPLMCKVTVNTITKKQNN